ncbi:hypothetical protein BD626DRAFT_473205 [Schizophyllum amplum]|uniref:Uncharacterized protein n=1 Tax=Schizophyllum amplum TaxID=97359 RepID=A0A550CWN4_9AGAR|nr:hypothetical protein BD626DRAFT_473205 [Auriculariopsis ampla]
MSHSTRKTADIITYRFNDRLVYVSPEKNYQTAVDVALQEYADELAGIARERIAFYTMASMDGQRREVRIGQSAWPRAMDKLARGEVVDIVVKADPSAPPPQYLEVPGAKAASGARSRSPSPSPSERSMFRRFFGFSSSPAPSRSSSPSSSSNERDISEKTRDQ